MKLSSKKNGNYVKVPINKLSKSLQVKLGIFINIQATNLSTIFAVDGAKYMQAKEKEQLIFCDNKYISIKTGKDQEYCKKIIDCLINFLSDFPSYKLVNKVQCWKLFNMFKGTEGKGKDNMIRELKSNDDIGGHSDVGAQMPTDGATISELRRLMDNRFYNYQTYDITDDITEEDN